MEENKISEEKDIKNKKEKKVLTTKQMIIHRVIFVIIFLIIAILVTAYFITSNQEATVNTNEIKTDKKVEETKAEHQGLIDLASDTYDLNDLKITEYSGNIGDLEYNYYQIDGLKNYNIEVSINYVLKNDVEKSITKAVEENKINKENFYVSNIINSNFANTLSISYYVNSYNYDEETSEYEDIYVDYIGENFDLTTGNRIKLSDIFTDDTTGQMLFDSKFYNELVPNYTEQYMNEEDWNLRITDYKDIEEEMADLINKFNNKKEIAFSFDEQKITILNYYANIYYEDHLDYVAIYDKYKNNQTIFDGEYSALKNLPVLVKREYCEYQIIEEGDNYYIDISLSNVWREEWRNEVVFEKIKEYIQNEIEQVKEEASQKPNKFIIANYNYLLSVNTLYFEDELVKDDLAGYTCNYTKLTYETTKSMFKAELKDKIIEVFRNAKGVGGEAYLYDNLFLYYISDYNNMNSYYGDFGIYNDGEFYDIENQDDVIWGIED